MYIFQADPQPWGACRGKVPFKLPLFQASPVVLGGVQGQKKTNFLCPPNVLAKEFFCSKMQQNKLI